MNRLITKIRYQNVHLQRKIKLYCQVDGVNVDSPVGSIFTDIFVENMERKKLLCNHVNNEITLLEGFL